MQMEYLDFAFDLPVNGRVHFSSAEESEEAMQRHDVNQQGRRGHRRDETDPDSEIVRQRLDYAISSMFKQLPK